jgi:hypothetical protein
MIKTTDSVVQTEVLLNMINTLFSQAVCFHDESSIKELHDIRHQVYYGNYEYGSLVQTLQRIQSTLKKYEAI